MVSTFIILEQIISTWMAEREGYGLQILKVSIGLQFCFRNIFYSVNKPTYSYTIFLCYCNKYSYTVIYIEDKQATATSESRTDDKTTTTQADQPWLPVVEQLKGMGFDDDGGWLSELVKAKSNDIHKVLDALNHGR